MHLSIESLCKQESVADVLDCHYDTAHQPQTVLPHWSSSSSVVHDSSIGPDTVSESTAPSSGSADVHPSRTIGHSTTRWDSLRHIIEDLYVKQQLPLAEVRHYMIRHHGFDATVQMYKKRLAKWELRKYYPRNLKVALKRHLAVNPSFNGGLLGQPLKKHRLYRAPASSRHRPSTSFLPDAQPLQRACEATQCTTTPDISTMSQESLDSSTASEDNSGWETNQASNGADIGLADLIVGHTKNYTSWYFNPAYTPVRVQLSDDSRRSEHILHIFNTYCEWYCNQEASKKFYGYGSALANVFDVISSSLPWLSQRSENGLQRAFHRLHKASDQVSVLLEQEPFQLIHNTIAEFSKEGWNVHKELKAELLRLLSTMASISQQRSHPVARILGLLREANEIPGGLGARLLCLSSDIIDSASRANAEEPLVYRLSMVTFLCNIADIPQAEEQCLDLLERGKDELTAHHWIMRRAWRQLGWIRLRQSKNEEAEQAWLHALDLTFDDQGTDQADRVATQVCGDLGDLYSRVGDLARSEGFWKFALDGGYGRWGVGDPDVLLTLTKLEEALLKQGKVNEVEQLREEYGWVFEVWNDFDVDDQGHPVEDKSLDGARDAS